MRIDVEGFGCVPDGRIPDAVLADDGSSAMRATSGGLRAGGLRADAYVKQTDDDSPTGSSPK